MEISETDYKVLVAQRDALRAERDYLRRVHNETIAVLQSQLNNMMAVK